MEDSSISSTTAWSNNASVYSLPNSDPDHLADEPALIDWISERDGRGIRRTGRTRPFGRGVLHGDPDGNDQGGRPHGPGVRPGLLGGNRLVPPQPHHGLPVGPGSVMLRLPRRKRNHEGRGSRSATATGSSTRTRRSSISATRSTSSQLIALSASSIIDGMNERGLRRIIISAAREQGYRLETSRLQPTTRRHGRGAVPNRPRWHPAPTIIAAYRGIRDGLSVGEGGVLSTVEAIVGQPPGEIRIFDRGRVSRRVGGGGGPIRCDPRPASGAVPRAGLLDVQDH